MISPFAHDRVTPKPQSPLPPPPPPATAFGAETGARAQLPSVRPSVRQLIPLVPPPTTPVTTRAPPWPRQRSNSTQQQQPPGKSRAKEKRRLSSPLGLSPRKAVSLLIAVRAGGGWCNGEARIRYSVATSATCPTWVKSLRGMRRNTEKKALVLMRMKDGKIDTVLAMAANLSHAAAVPA